jgi:Methyltransferase domain
MVTKRRRSLIQRLPGAVKATINWALAPLDAKIVRRNETLHDWRNVQTFIPFEPTLKAAREAGLSLGDYIDTVMNRIPGATQATIDQMARLGVFADKVDTVVEIGPGSGRYLEKTLAACHPSRCEIYETAGPWAEYVRDTLDVILQPTNGRTLAATPDGSVDLVQAHKVFSATPFLTTARYWIEMCRVLRAGGFAIFDIVTETCMDPASVTRWVASQGIDSTYPAMMPRATTVDFFTSRGLSLVGSFVVPMGSGTTETFVFRKP